MKLFVRLLALLFLLASCNSQKTTVKKSIEDYQKEGFTVGTIGKGNGDCTSIIAVNELKIKYDPVNISDEKFAGFASKTGVVVFKFLPLRMKNRCNDASPISLIEIQEVK